jgi:hypothetical protein
MADDRDRDGEPAGPALAGSGMPIEALAAEAHGLDLEAFTARHGIAFLMASATGRDGSKGTTSTHLFLDGFDDDPGARTASVAIVVYRLQPKPGSDGRLLTIGREKRHDVVIADPSVSRFHAFAKFDERGHCALQDMGSTNGTSVNGASVPARGAGPAAPVKPGDTVRIGQVDFTFTDARAMYDFARQVGG